MNFIIGKDIFVVEVPSEASLNISPLSCTLYEYDWWILKPQAHVD